LSDGAELGIGLHIEVEVFVLVVLEIETGAPVDRVGRFPDEDDAEEKRMLPLIWSRLIMLGHEREPNILVTPMRWNVDFDH